MALATRCPNCATTFRVVADQLKLRGGLVRCGSCRHVFDAISSITYVEDPSGRDGLAATTPAHIASDVTSDVASNADAPAPAPIEPTPAVAAPLPPPPPPVSPPVSPPAQPRATSYVPPPVAAPGPAVPSFRMPSEAPTVRQEAVQSPRRPSRSGSRAPAADADRLRIPDTWRSAPAADRGEEPSFSRTPHVTPRRQDPPFTIGTPQALSGVPPAVPPAPAPAAQVPAASLSILPPGSAPPPPHSGEKSGAENRGGEARMRALFDGVDNDAIGATENDEIAGLPSGAPTTAEQLASSEGAPLTLSLDTAFDGPERLDLEDEAPDFLRESTIQQKGFSVFFTVGVVILATALVVQLGVLLRSELIARWPALRPALVQVCRFYGCTVGWPMRAESLAVVGTDLQSVPGTDVLELTAVVRNRAAFRMALPSIELTLTDVQGHAVARKVFAPADYLASSGTAGGARIDEGLDAGADLSIRVTFEARGLTAVGFVVYPFFL
jgi:predicted Zn finger-like uncharacterized protein